MRKTLFYICLSALFAFNLSAQNQAERKGPPHMQRGERGPHNMVERYLSNLKEEHPEEFERLTKLREQNPEEFRQELRNKVMNKRKEFQNKRNAAPQFDNESDKTSEDRSRKGTPEHRKRFGDKHFNQHNLEKRRPFEKIPELKNTAEQIRKQAQKLKEAESDNEKEESKTQLKILINQMFDLQQEMRIKRIAQAKKDIAALEKMVQHEAENKDLIIEKHLETIQQSIQKKHPKPHNKKGKGHNKGEAAGKPSPQVSEPTAETSEDGT